VECGFRLPACLASWRLVKHGNLILAAYPYLEAEDIGAALLYAAALAEDETLDIAS
jgi:hypothetical protein